MLTTPFSEHGYQPPLTRGAHEFSYGAPLVGLHRAVSNQTFAESTAIAFNPSLSFIIFLAGEIKFAPFREGIYTLFLPTVGIPTHKREMSYGLLVNEQW